MQLSFQVGVNIGVPVPREPFSFGGSNISKFGDSDITGTRFFHQTSFVFFDSNVCIHYFRFNFWLLFSRLGVMFWSGDGGMEFFTKRKKVTTKWNPPQNQDWMS